VIHRLWFRLLVAFALVIVVAIGTVYGFVSRGIRGEIERYEEIRGQIHIVETQEVLADHYHEYGSWEGVNMSQATGRPPTVHASYSQMWPGW